MFGYEYPEFEKKQLLRAGKLEQLRDYPRNYTRLLFQGYGDGIVSGCELSWEPGFLTINSGMIYWKGNLYFLKKQFRMECPAADEVRCLVVSFLPETKEAGVCRGTTSLYLSKEQTHPPEEIELCRFRLQQGFRLRSEYTNFEDYATEFNTMNVIHAPFASVGGSTIHPNVLSRFAEEMLETELADVCDITFCMNVLAAEGNIGRKLLLWYLRRKGKHCPETADNMVIYRRLISCLESRRGNGNEVVSKEQGQKKVMLI